MLATAVGSYPGEGDTAYAETVKMVLAELPGLPHVPELPGRGATASLAGRGLAVMSGLGADLQPAGWRLTDSPGVDHRRARSLLAQDLDTVEELTQGYVGPFKTQIAGPWTLAATVERPRGDKVLADHGARRELAQALAEGVSDHVADLRRRLSGVDRLIVQVDEPALAAVLGAEFRPPRASAGTVPCTLRRHRERSSGSWRRSPRRAPSRGCTPAPRASRWGLVRGAGARGLSVDLAMLSAGDYDTLAEALEAGVTVALGVVPTLEPAGDYTDKQAVNTVERWLDMLGLDPEGVGDRLVITPTCGFAGASAPWVLRALRVVVSAARQLSRG